MSGDLFTPTEWIKWQAHLSAKKLESYVPHEEDLAPNVHVLVTTWVTDTGCYQVSNVVLRDVRKTTVIQPSSFTPDTHVYQNAFGATVTCQGAIATFGLDQMEALRSLDSNREFLVSVLVPAGVASDWKVTRKDFVRLD